MTRACRLSHAEKMESVGLTVLFSSFSALFTVGIVVFGHYWLT